MKICPGDENVSSSGTVYKTSFHSIWSFVDSVYFSDYIIKALEAKLGAESSAFCDLILLCYKFICVNYQRTSW